MYNIKQALASIPIYNRLKVVNEMAFIDLIWELGYREGMWTNSEADNAILIKISELAEKHAKHIMEEYAKWERDGKPKNI